MVPLPLPEPRRGVSKLYALWNDISGRSIPVTGVTGYGDNAISMIITVAISDILTISPFTQPPCTDLQSSGLGGERSIVDANNSNFSTADISHILYLMEPCTENFSVCVHWLVQ